MKILFSTINKSGYTQNTATQNNYNKQIPTPINQITKLSDFPKSYISFTGGYSISLKETFDNFERAEKKTGKKVAPPRVEQEMFKQLEMGNPDELTLIDVHKKVYKGLTNADSLDEIRKKYPEFENTKSASEVDLSDSKYVDNIQKGHNNVFNNKEDLSLQILKLYWGEGFSLSDIVANTNTPKATLSNIMEKLNLPRVSNRYGAVLKLSDKEYNARISAAMADKMAEIHALKNGLPLIPHKVSDEQKEKISNGLIKYYADNPERLHEMSQRQKDFYKNHPEAALTLKLVMYKAWNMNSCSVVKRKLKEFLKEKHKFSQNDESLFPTDMSEKQQKLMKTFWDQNPYLKKKFSHAVKQSYDKINTLPDLDLMKNVAGVPFLPKLLEQRMITQAKAQGEKTNNLDLNNLGLKLAPDNILKITKEHKIINNFFRNRTELKLYNNALSQHLIGIHSYCERKSNNANTETYSIIANKIKNFMHPQRNISINDVLKLYAEIVQTMKKDNLNEDIRILNSYFNFYYENAFKQLTQKNNN
ncbi:hypothetical protein IJE86_07530 [bacterium]|nr:hypothetical protein [bacterium]